MGKREIQCRGAVIQWISLDTQILIDSLVCFWEWVHNKLIIMKFIQLIGMLFYNLRLFF